MILSYSIACSEGSFVAEMDEYGLQIGQKVFIKYEQKALKIF